ncbi:MAG: polysaccharide deacetylase family protein [Spirochaetes bacterium]|nr:polysaccharide deacetylase family protein [Spirochaetota bacterium]
MVSAALRPRRSALAILLSVLVVAVGFSEAAFSGLDLAEDNRLLFRATVEAPDFGSYDTLFLADVGDSELEQLTVFPERMAILPDTGQLQIQNRYGVFRTNRELENLAPVADFPSFVNGSQIRSGKISPISTSPDGRFLVFLRETSPAFGSLVLKDLDEGREIVVSERIELELSGAPVKWAPGSEFFIYGKQNTLYYYSLDQLTEGRVIAEEFRDLGNGSVESASWAADGSLYYLSGSLVYRARDIEFFPRTLYQELLQVGDIVGKIPFVFDPNFDSFHIAPDGRTILLNKGGRNVFLLYLRGDDFVSTGSSVTYPYLSLPRNTRVKRVAWSSIGMLTVLTESMLGGSTQTGVYRMSIPVEPADIDVDELDVRGLHDMVLGPRGRSIALLFRNRVEVRDYESWEVQASLSYHDPLHLIWRDAETFVVGGSSRIEQVEWEAGERQLLALSDADGFGYHRDSGAVLTVSRGSSYRYEDGRFVPADGFDVRAAQGASNRYRVYLESFDSGSYENIVMIRQSEDVGTTPLFAPPVRRYEPFPEEGREVDFRNFAHGSRTRAREVAFVFNAIDSVEGLTRILNTLSEYDIQATFFVNGDFIRRHPGAVREIDDSGHEVGSLFYTYFDMTDARYEITKDFVTEGLARNEDDYFEVTGSELSLLWHAPYYFVSPAIIRASQEMSYTYVSRDVDALDWVPRRDGRGVTSLYRSSAEIVERILEEKQPGSVIAMRVGTPGESSAYGGRDDYLFQKLDLLINRLTERGYDIVPVSTLIEHAR